MNNCIAAKGSIHGNYRLLEVVMRSAERAWRYWLNRRSQHGTITGQKIAWWQAHFPLPPLRLVPNI